MTHEEAMARAKAAYIEELKIDNLKEHLGWIDRALEVAVAAYFGAGKDFQPKPSDILAVHTGAKSAIMVAYERRLKRYRSGCACHVNDEDELAGICGLHQQLVEDTRNAALEEAALVAEESAKDAMPDSEYALACNDLAEALRALAGGKQE